MNEVYARAHLNMDAATDPEDALATLIDSIKVGLEETINQPEKAKVKVQRWFPGVVEEIVEEISEKSKRNITQRLLNEAADNLERKQHIQTNATKDKTISEILGNEGPEKVEAPKEEGKADEAPKKQDAGLVKFQVPDSVPAADGKRKAHHRVRQKMRSTPVVGGGLFGEHIEAKSGREASSKIGDFAAGRNSDFLGGFKDRPSRGIAAELSVRGENYHIRISTETLRDLQKGFSGQMVDSRGIEISAVNISATNEDTPVVQRLQGFVRNMPLQQIREETIDESEKNSVDSSLHGPQQETKNL